MLVTHNNRSTALIFAAILVAHGALLSLKLAPEIIIAPPALAPIQLTRFGADAPFVPGVPVAVVPKKPAPRPTQKLTLTQTPSAVVSTKVESQESAIDSTPAAGSGGVASEFSSAGAMAQGDLRQIYLSELRAKLEEVKHYPQQARRLGQTGSVEVAFMVHADGLIDNARIVRPSPFKRLNDSALETVASLKKFRPLPEGLASNPLVVTLPIRYSIRN